MFTRFVGEALLVRHEEAASQEIVSTKQKIRVWNVSADRVHAPVPGGSIIEAELDRSDNTASVMFLRSAAQPLGP